MAARARGGFALRRLAKDLAALRAEPVLGASACVPNDDEPYTVHATLVPTDGRFVDIPFHLTLRYDADYPKAPPDVKLRTAPAAHPNVYGDSLCLDMLRPSHAMYMGWSAAYTVSSVLMQLMSFMFEEAAIPQDYGGARRMCDESAADVINTRRRALSFRCPTCPHVGTAPYPPLPDPAEVLGAAAGVAHAAATSTDAAAPMCRINECDADPGLVVATGGQSAIAFGSTWQGARSTVAVRAGSKVVYHARVTLASDAPMRESVKQRGIVRVGWACADSSREIGHDATSIGYGGTGKIAFEGVFKTFGMPFKAGNVVTTMLDLGPSPTVTFAVDGVRVGAGPLPRAMVGRDVYPAVTLKNAQVELMFGDTPSRFPEMAMALQRDGFVSLAVALARGEAVYNGADAHDRDPAFAVGGATGSASHHIADPAEEVSVVRVNNTGGGGDPCDEPEEANNPVSATGGAGGKDADTAVRRASDPLAFDGKLAAAPSMQQAAVQHGLRCFYTRQTADEAVLGIGINVPHHHGRGAPQYDVVLDVLSAQAYCEHDVGKGVWGQPFTHFLPLVVSEEHVRRAGPLIIAALCDLDSPDSSRSRLKETYAHLKRGDSEAAAYPARISPDVVLRVLPQLMNQMVVGLVAKDDAPDVGVTPQHASERALSGYCALHHILVWLANENPEIRRMAAATVKRFRHSPAARMKDATPNLGHLLVLMTLADESWEDLAIPFMREVFDRNVMWVLRKHPFLDVADADDGPTVDRERLQLTFGGSIVSARLCMFQTYFLRHVGRPKGSSVDSVLAAYNASLGQPPAGAGRLLHAECRDILRVNDYFGYFPRCGLVCPSAQQITRMLREACVNSRSKGYHGRPRGGGRHGGRHRDGRGGRYGAASRGLDFAGDGRHSRGGRSYGGRASSRSSW